LVFVLYAQFLIMLTILNSNDLLNHEVDLINHKLQRKMKDMDQIMQNLQDDMYVLIHYHLNDQHESKGILLNII
jgi:hypothetical protein